LDSEPETTEEFKTYTRMKERDRRRWKVADVDGDDSLTKEEFQNFIHPEDVAHMKDIVVIETIEDIDKDGDGKISLEEYISKFVLLFFGSLGPHSVPLDLFSFF